MNGNQNRAGIAILMSGKVDIKPKLVKRDTEGCCILRKVPINQEYTMSVIM